MSKAVTKKTTGRPSKMTGETLRKLEEGFSFGMTDVEASLFAGIGARTLYDYMEAHPEFRERRDELKQNPVMLARQTVTRAIQRDSRLAFEYLKSKRGEEFSTTNITQAVQVNVGDLRDKYKKDND